LEWLPQETIVFDGAQAALSSRVALTGNAVFIGFDIVCLGRTASGERFRRGSYRHCLEMVRDNALLWTERTILRAEDALVRSPVGLNASPMFGTFVVAAATIPDDLLAACRCVAVDAADAIDVALTQFPGMLIARCRGSSAEDARRWFIALWSLIRPALCGRAALPPRVWNT
jgi:urease accessory protein